MADRCKRNLERHRQACSDADVKVAERVAQRRRRLSPSDDAGRASLLVAGRASRPALAEEVHKDDAEDKALVQIHSLLVKAVYPTYWKKRPVLLDMPSQRASDDTGNE